MGANWQKELYLAASGGPHRVLELWSEWEASPPEGSHLPVAKTLIRMSRNEEALAVLEGAGEDLEVVQQRSLALSKSERIDEAIRMLQELVEAGHDDAETLGLLGGRYKQQARRAGDNKVLLLKSFATYLKAYQGTEDTYPGINAAALGLEIGQTEKSQEIASKILGQLTDLSEFDTNDWKLATRGEAHILLGDLDAARYWYQFAVGVDPNAIQNIATMRDQARRNLRGLGLDAHALDDVFALRTAAAFTGHMVDAPDRASPRFPERIVGDVRLQIRERLRELDIGFGFCSAASGSDLLFLEELLDRGGSAEVFLPFPASDFIGTSVGPDWKEAFEKALAHPKVRVTELLDALPPEAGRDAAYGKCNERIHAESIAFSRRIDEKPCLMAVWNGQPGDGAGGTADSVRAWEKKGWVFDLIDIFALVGPETTRSKDLGSDTSAKKRNLEVKGRAKPAAVASLTSKWNYANKYCLSIGVTRTKDWTRLDNPEHDATKVAETLSDCYGFKSELMVNEDATAARITAYFKDHLVDTVKPDDLFVLFFAGHGHTRYKNGEAFGYLVPSDADGTLLSKLIDMGQVTSWSRMLECRHVLYIFDSCFSGIAALLSAARAPQAADQEQARLVITAGLAKEEVYDGGTPDHSIFTDSLLKALRREPGPFGGPTSHDLYVSVWQSVMKWAQDNGVEQQPTLGQLTGHQGGVILLKRTD